MIGGIAELNIDGGDSLEVMTDVQLVPHANTAMKLDSLLGDETGSVADLRLRAGRQSGSMWLPCHEAKIQMLGKRNGFLERDEHVDHAVLQNLEAAKRDPELLAHLAVFKRRRIQLGHCTDRFRAKRGNSAVTACFQCGHALTFRSQQLAHRNLHIHQRDFGGTPAINGLEPLQVEIGRMPIYGEQTDAAVISRAAGGARRHDQLIRPWRTDDGGFGAAQNIMLSLTTRGGGNVVKIVP